MSSEHVRGSAGLPDYHCPVCGTPSGMVVSSEQAFCTNEDNCRVLMFTPSMLDGGMNDPQIVDLSRLDP